MATNLQMFIKIATGADVSGLNKTDAGIKKLGKTAQAVSKQTSMLGALTGKIFGGINFDMVRQGFMNYLQFEKDLGAMKSRFFAITHDEKLASEEFKYISKVAIDTANDIKSVTDSYSIFYASARRSLGQEGARGVFEAWTKIGRVLHLDSEAFGRVTYALREMSSKGQLYSQDLKMQLGTHVPDAVDIASTAIQNLGIAGVDTVEKFQELTKKNPKSGLMAKFLIEFSKEAEKRFASPEALAKALRQPDALAQMIPNMFWQFMTKFSEAGGNEVIVNILTMTFDILNAVPWDAIAKATGTMAKYLSQHLPQILSLLKDIAISVAIFYTFGKVLGLIRGISTFVRVFTGFSKGAPFVMRVFYSLGRAIPKLGAFLFGQGLKSSLKGVFGALLGVTGPLGWIFTALMFLPEIIHLCKWIGGIIDRKFGISDKKWLAKPFTESDLTAGQVVSIAEQLQKDLRSGKIKNSIDWQNKVAGYGGSSIYTELNYKDGNVYIYNNGQEITPEAYKVLVNERANKIINAGNMALKPGSSLIKR